MKTENVVIQDVKGVEIQCGNCGLGLRFSNPLSSHFKTECAACGHDLATGILAAQQWFAFEKSASTFSGEGDKKHKVRLVVQV
jgi:hypothetical protein